MGLATAFWTHVKPALQDPPQLFLCTQMLGLEYERFPMNNQQNQISRREFLNQTTAGVAVATVAGIAVASSISRAAESHERVIGIQVGSISFVDEGVDSVLDRLKQRGAVNTVFLTTFTYGRGLGGRQIPGQPFPDHGNQESDETSFHGGNYAAPH